MMFVLVITVSYYVHNPSHSPSPELLIKLLTREGPVNRLAVFIEHTVGRGFPRFPFPEIRCHKQYARHYEENSSELNFHEDHLNASPDEKLDKKYCVVNS